MTIFFLFLLQLFRNKYILRHTFFFTSEGMHLNDVCFTMNSKMIMKLSINVPVNLNNIWLDQNGNKESRERKITKCKR